MGLRGTIFRARTTWVCAAAAGLLLVGGMAGHLITPPSVTAGPVLPPLEVSAAALPHAQATAMPDVLGLEPDIATRVLADAGIDADIELEKEPAAGDVGRVVGQDPIPGAQLAGNQAVAVALQVSTPAKMPDLAGASADDARTDLEALGAIVTYEPVVRPAMRPRLVLGTQPDAGAPVGEVVVLQVTDPGQSLGLDLLPMLDYESCSSDEELSISGQVLAAGIVCEPYRGSPAHAVWNLSRKAVLLTGTIGLEDRGETGAAQVRVIVDGATVWERSVTFGTATPLRIPVANALRVNIETTTSAEDTAPTVAFGDLSALGRPDAIAALQDLS